MHSKDCPGAHVLIRLINENDNKTTTTTTITSNNKSSKKTNDNNKTFKGLNDFIEIKKDIKNNNVNKYKNNNNNNFVFAHSWSGVIQMASNLAAFYSDKRNDKNGVDITVVEPQHIMKPKYVYIYICVCVCVCVYVT